jgi:MFS family permease
MGLLMATYYLPLWYQATRGVTATRSGLNILPYMLSTVVAAAVSGGIISKTGRYWPFLLGSPLLLSVGAGLLYTISSNTNNGTIIAFQIIYGIGVGGAMQNTIISIQAEFADDEAMIPQATSLVNFTQLLGGVFGLVRAICRKCAKFTANHAPAQAIAGTLFANQIRDNLPASLDPETAKAVVGSVTIIHTLPDAIRSVVVEAYVKSLRPVFIIAVPAGAFASASAL